MGMAEESETDEIVEQSGELTLERALRTQLTRSLANDGLSRGLREVIKAIESGDAQVCILAKDCQKKEYQTLITALCSTRNVGLIQVEKRKDLGLWCGLGKLEEDGKIGKVVGCSSCAITDWGGQSPSRDKIEDATR